MPKNTLFCQAESCENTNKNCSLSFFLFPIGNQRRLEKWMSSIQMKPIARSRQYLCSNHFQIEAFTNTLKNRLLPESVPTIQVSDVHRETSCTVIDNEIRVDKMPTEYSKVCSCHFKDNLKKNGPTIFERDVDKAIYENYRKMKRRKCCAPNENTETESSSQELNISINNDIFDLMVASDAVNSERICQEKKLESCSSKSEN